MDCLTGLDLPSIPEFYANKSLLITGATGFVGKVITEKILRSCPDLATIYLLVRPKKDRSPAERVEELLEQPLFGKIRQECPEVLQKVVAVPGELTEEKLGLSESDASNLAARVTIVIHVAATIRFNEELGLAVQLNIVAVRRMLEFARTLKKCEAVIHTSTAYSQTVRNPIEEVIYPPSFDPQRLIDVTSVLDDDMIAALTPIFVDKRPNTYTFTKSLAEYLVSSEGKGLPVCVCRPSIVGAAWREPYPGWIDNYNGPSGLSVACGTGIMRVMPGRYEAKADIVPVDFVASFTVSVGWAVAMYYQHNPTPECLVFNCTSGNQNETNWGMWEDHVLATFAKYPLEKKIFRRPAASLAPRTAFNYKAWMLLSHALPAKLADLMLRLQGKKPRMVRTYEKLNKAMEDYAYFTENSWDWTGENTQKMISLQSPMDKKTFNLDLTHLHWKSYIETCCIGVKKYLLKEDMATIGRARRNMMWRSVISYLVKTGLFALLIRTVLPYMKRKGFSKRIWWVLLPLLIVSRKLQFV